MLWAALWDTPFRHTPFRLLTPADCAGTQKVFSAKEFCRRGSASFLPAFDGDRESDETTHMLRTRAQRKSHVTDAETAQDVLVGQAIGP